MIGMIAAVSQNGVMGKNNKLPWQKKYPSDLKRFKSMTLDSAIIMGRKTWESIGKRCLPRRKHFVVTSQREEFLQEGVLVATSLKNAIEFAKMDDTTIWIIGGATLYQSCMDVVDKIDLTIVPEDIDTNGAVMFPWINPTKFRINAVTPGEDGLVHVIYERI